MKCSIVPPPSSLASVPVRYGNMDHPPSYYNSNTAPFSTLMSSTCCSGGCSSTSSTCSSISPINENDENQRPSHHPNYYSRREIKQHSYEYFLFLRKRTLIHQEQVSRAKAMDLWARYELSDSKPDSLNKEATFPISAKDAASTIYSNNKGNNSNDDHDDMGESNTGAMADPLLTARELRDRTRRMDLPRRKQELEDSKSSRSGLLLRQPASASTGLGAVETKFHHTSFGAVHSRPWYRGRDVELIKKSPTRHGTPPRSLHSICKEESFDSISGSPASHAPTVAETLSPISCHHYDLTSPGTSQHNADHGRLYQVPDMC